MVIDWTRPWPVPISDTFRLTSAFLLLVRVISIGIASVVAFREANTTILPAGSADDGNR